MDRSKLHPTMARNRRRSSTQQTSIRRLFLEPLEFYSLAEGAQILGISCRAMIREAAQDRREAYRSAGVWRFTWRQVAYIACRRWSLGEIHDALGADAPSALPPLLALRSLTVRLPEYVTRALETLASDNNTTVDEYLLGELLDFAGTVSARLAQRIPGYRRAYLFPGQE